MTVDEQRLGRRQSRSLARRFSSALTERPGVSERVESMRMSAIRYARALAIAALERAVLSRASPLYFAWRLLRKTEFEALGPHFEPAFYLEQILSPSRRRLAARDPLMHYCVIGWREHRSPNPTFDPRFVEDDLFPGRIKTDPTAFVLRRQPQTKIPLNEVEAARAVPLTVPAVVRHALIFHHARGGGSSKYLAIFEAHMRGLGIEPLRLRLVSLSDRLVVVQHNDATDVFDLTRDEDSLVRWAKDKKVDLIVVSHLIDLHPTIFTLLPALVTCLNADLWFILHDYFSVCPRVNMVTSEGRPCYSPAPPACVRCVAKGGSEIGDVDPATWQSRFATVLRRADRILVPSADTRDRLGLLLGLTPEVWSPEIDPARALVAPRFRSSGTLQVGILGGLNVAKGGQVVLELARLVRSSRAPIEINVFGPSSMARQLKRVGVNVQGRYSDADLKDLLRLNRPDIIFLPAIWPETWSFVLTVALELGLHVLAFAHGAQLERLRRLGREDLVLPVDCFERPDIILSRLLAFRAAHLVGDPARVLPK